MAELRDDMMRFSAVAEFTYDIPASVPDLLRSEALPGGLDSWRPGRECEVQRPTVIPITSYRDGCRWSAGDMLAVDREKLK